MFYEQPMSRPIVIVCALALALVVPAAAAGATTTGPAPVKPRPVDPSAQWLWATINVCNTAAKPNGIGLRASMPGNGDPAVAMFMRFQVQYFNAKDGTWHNLSTGGDSGFVGVGAGRFRAREAGRVFTFAPPTGASFQLRGLVTFEWRKGTKVLRSTKRRTTAGHPSAAGADPVGYTAPTCVIG